MSGGAANDQSRGRKPPEYRAAQAKPRSGGTPITHVPPLRGYEFQINAYRVLSPLALTFRASATQNMLLCPMGNTYTQLYLHLVFSTKHRDPLITPEIESRLYPYIAGICSNLKAHLVRGGGFTDHCHLLVRKPPTLAESDLLRTIEANTSKWLGETSPESEFEWQDSYAALSVSTSALDDVVRYIDRQHDHHRERDFKTELIAFLDRHGVEYDPKYVFE